MKKDPVAVEIPIIVQSNDSLDKALYSTTNIRSYRGVPSKFEQSHVNSKDQYFIGNVSRYRDPFMNSKTRIKVLTWEGEQFNEGVLELELEQNVWNHAGYPRSGEKR